MLPKRSVIHTARLMLSPLQDSDLADCTALLLDSRISETYLLPDFKSAEDAKKLSLPLQQLSLDPQHFLYAIHLGEQFVGFLNDVEINDQSIELGYVVVPAFQNRGIAAEALTAAIWELFRIGYFKVQCGCFAENTASARVMEKVGMHPIDFTDTIEYRGRLHTCQYCEISSSLKRIGDVICFLPAIEEPLSADVFCISGKKRNYYYDVGRSDDAFRFVQPGAGEDVVILSHFHGDHIENMTRLHPQSVYGGNKTIQKLGFGTVVRERLTLQDGVFLEIIPCPSVHASGCLILNVNREYCLIGDLIYSKPPLNISLANEMLIALTQVDTKYFVMSHGAEEIWKKEVFLRELKAMIEEAKKNECTN